MKVINLAVFITSPICLLDMSDPADWEPEWHEKIVEKIRFYPQHRFAILTKRPKVYEKYYFPENVWCGVTIVSPKFYIKWSLVLDSLRRRQLRNHIMFFSIEPIMNSFDCSIFEWTKPNWIIVGPETGTRRKTPGEWLDPFFSLDIPVFMKNACSQMTNKQLRQEWPKGWGR